MMKRSSLPDHIESKFNAAVKGERKRKKRTSPVSIRFSNEQRAALEPYTNGQALGPYIKENVLQGHNVGAKPNNRNTVRDYEALARLLRALGQSELRTHLCALYELADAGQFVADEETIDQLRQASDHIASMRSDLVSALGLRERSGE
ncbi:hypothetical protein IWQ49_006665 [Labrenzia sp. EL_126]|nr:hypothetical protein [Labrenzia sp. EL_126]